MAPNCNVCNPSYFCSGNDLLLVFEVGKTIKAKVRQVYKKRKSFLSFIPVKSGVFYFKSKSKIDSHWRKNSPDFCAHYKSIPQKLILESYLDEFEYSKIFVHNEIKSGIINKDPEKIYSFLQINKDDEYSNGIGKLCELIVIEDLKRMKIGNLFSNQIIYFNNEYYPEQTEIDVLVSGHKTIYSEIMSDLKDRSYLDIVKFIP